jgi:NADH-quinone oxidoreductase subunit F
MLVPVDDPGRQPHVTAGPLLSDFLEGSGSGLEGYLRCGGYTVARQVFTAASQAQLIEKVDAAGLRGRGGGGFPTGLKWLQVANSQQAERYFVCNVHAGQPGGFKESFLVRSNPHRVVEAASLAGSAVGAKAVVIYLGRQLEQEERALITALREAREAGWVGPAAGGPDLLVYRSPGGYITGEETSVLELLEGRVGRPRGKPPMLTRKGLLGAPTAVNNLETVLHAFFIAKFGPERFRETGTAYSPGTLLLCLSGEVERPGLYELPLGTPMRSLVVEHGGGIPRGRAVKALLPGGVSSRVLGPEALDLPLEYDALRDIGADLGSGVVIVISDATSSVDLAIALARFYSENSCGKCQPCKDGTRRSLFMLEHLEDLDRKAVDHVNKALPPSPRAHGLTILNQPNDEAGGISYTDTAMGLDKIRVLCEWYKYRGDCHHATEAASSIQSLLELFAPEFEERRGGATASV